MTQALQLWATACKWQQQKNRNVKKSTKIEAFSLYLNISTFLTKTGKNSMP